MTMAQKIKDMSNALGVSIYQLEQNAGLKQGAIYNILSGRSKSPTITTLNKVAVALKCSVADLMPPEQVNDNRLANKQSRDSSKILDHDLYLSCVECIIRLVRAKQFIMTKNQISLAIDETYNYSLHSDEKSADEKFANWYINRLHMV